MNSYVGTCIKIKLMHSQSPSSLLIYVDGSSRGNPGPSGIGIVVFDNVNQTKSIQEISRYIGTTTNNVAEYEAVISALKWMVTSNKKCATIKLDSELVYCQITGKYKVRSHRMAVQLRRVKILEAKIANLSFQLVPRTDNKLADRLAQKASKKTNPVGKPTINPVEPRRMLAIQRGK